MRYCGCENEEFPSSQFHEEGGQLMHYPPGGKPHPVEKKPSPPPAPLRLMTADLFGDRKKRKPNR